MIRREKFRLYARGTCLELSLSWVFACQQAVPVREFTATDPHVPDTWEEVFTGRKLELEIPGPELLRISQVVVGSRGQLYIPRGVGAATILELDREGRLVNEVQVGDSGAFATFSVFAVGPEGNLFVFHPDGRWVTVLSSPDGRVLRRFQISSWPSAMLVLQDGSIVTYSALGESERYYRDLLRGRNVGRGRVFQRFDQDGRRVAAAHRVRDDALRIFHGRVHTGGIVQWPDGDLMGLHPAEFELVRLSPDLRVLELLRAPEDDPWSPHPPSFPPGLDPYNYRPPHEEWWDSFRHIGRTFALTPELLLITLWDSRGMADAENFANVYRANGELLAQGLRVPHGGRIVGAAGRVVYVVRNASISDDGLVEPLEFYEYALRGKVSTSWNPRSVRNREAT